MKENRPAKNCQKALIAIDTTSLTRAHHILTVADKYIGGIKIGLEFFTFHGIGGIRKLLEGRDSFFFLDLKFHDIPNTVEAAVTSVMQSFPNMINVHIAGGVEMMRRAKFASLKQAERLRIPPPLVVGVSVLTSLQDSDLQAVGYTRSTLQQAVRMAELAQKAGLDGVVCSAHEVSAIRQVCGKDFTLVVPGIRVQHTDTHDQKRVMTPRQAIQGGADYIILGRSITQAKDIAQETQLLAQSIENI